jgi:hypothetical protein
MFASFQNVLFTFDNSSDNDLAVYEYELYKEDDIVDPNTPELYILKPNPLIAGQYVSPFKSGAGNSSVFAVPVEGSYIDVENNNIVVQKNFFGRVRARDTSGNPGQWTDIKKTDPSTPLIDSQYIVSLTASKIKAGEIESAAITLGGANPLETIIQSKTYVTSSGQEGWYIDGAGEFSLGGPEGINYSGGSITIGSDVQVNANLAADSISVGSGLSQLNINDSIGPIVPGSDPPRNVGGMALGQGLNNYWYGNGNFRVGNDTNYVIWNGTSLSIKGAITADSGTFNGTVNATAGTFTGTVNAAAGNFSGGITLSGRLQANTVAVGNMNHIDSNFNGIDLSGGFTNCFIRRTTGETYFRVDNGSQWIKFDNGVVSINAAGFSIINGNATFSGNLSGAGGTLTAGMTIGGSLRIGDNVRVNDATADGGATTFKVRGSNNTSSRYAARFQRQSGTYILEVRNDLKVGIGSGGTYNLSDKRTKTNIKDSDLGLKFINSLKPRAYNLIDNYDEILENKDYTEPVISDKKMYGFIAQEVKEIADQYSKDYGGWDKSEETTLQSISYEQLISPIVKAIQELSQKIDEIQLGMI